MKRVIIIAVMVLGFAMQGWGQEEEGNIEKEISELKAEVSKLSQIINENLKDDTQNVSTIKANDDLSNVEIFEYIERKYKPINRTIKIDSIKVLTKDGYIVELQAIANGKTFSNANAPIALTTKRMNNGDVLVYNEQGENIYIYMSDILQFVSSKPYISDDDDFVLKQGEEHMLKKGVGINSIFDLRLYTDGLAVFGDKPNGIFQTEANFRQIISRKNIWNCGIIPAHYVKVRVNANKFDSEFGGVDSINFNRSSLYQRSWLNASVSLNLFNVWLENKSLSSFYTDLGTGMNASKLAKSNDTISVLSYYFFAETGADLKISDNIDANFSSRFLWNYSPQTDFGNQHKERFFISPQIDLSWYPVGNKSSRIFLRSSYTVDTSDKKNHFLQLQFGYSILLSELVSKNNI